MIKKKIAILFVLLAVVFGGGIWLGNQQSAPTATAEDLRLDEQEATIRAIVTARPAVVSIIVYDYTEAEFRNDSGRLGSVSTKIVAGQGSGFLISQDGYILTNKHVVDAAKTDQAEFQIIMNDDREYFAQLIDKDPFNDLAVLRVYDDGLPYLELGSSQQTPIGTTVMAIGNALGRYQNSVTKGIVSGLGREVLAADKSGGSELLDNVLQTDAEINEGNSGGPLIDLEGKVVGINVAVDRGGEALGFAIPIDDAKPVIESVIAEGMIVRPWLGVRYMMLDKEYAESNSLPRNNGAWISPADSGEYSVIPGSPAMRAGLRPGDIIFEVNAVEVNEKNTLSQIIQRYKPGDKIGLKVQRGDKQLVLQVRLGKFPKE